MQYYLLTGATGLLGRYLLRDLTLAELPLAVELPLLGAELPLLVVPRLATPGTLDPLLHAASPIAAATTRTASPGRRHLAVLSRLPGPFVAGR